MPEVFVTAAVEDTEEMKRILTLPVTLMLLLAASAILSVGGCATSNDSLVAVRYNNSKISTLQPGMTPQEAVAHIGSSGYESIPNPFKSEMYTLGDDFFRILFFYTQLRYDTDNITDDELIPIVFKNDSLDGWGWTHWENTATQYNIQIRRR